MLRNSYQIKYQNVDSLAPIGVHLPLSKSLSHRHLFLHYLLHAHEPDFKVSGSRDTLLFKESLNPTIASFNFQDAGTPARFALVYHAIKGTPIVLTGNESLCRRSIKDLVDTLQQIGCKIDYLEKSGYFPVRIAKGINTPIAPLWHLTTNESSQFASALLLGMSSLEPKPSLEIHGLNHSWSYIDMTLSVLHEWGVSANISESCISLEGNLNKNMQPKIEIDWGSASFIYLICLFTQKSFLIHHAFDPSNQGDFACVSHFQKLGIQTQFLEQQTVPHAHIDYKPIVVEQELCIQANDFPDLIPALCSALSFLSVNARLEGIGNLKTKESNRIESLRVNLASLGCSLMPLDEETYYLNTDHKQIPDHFEIQSFHDHRIAMAFAPWASVIKRVYIDDAGCVEKSFPDFWHVMKLCNFELLNQP